ncbi:PAS domain-containing protein [Pseudenhygromyxa sp. WMMC2535]|uniref:PAS domain-containing sensor histidine kinase n=1 Tax=Pseudenhygromyxa sp. WMMC2535 TaxID=2712867 RepID=UPI0015558160|nr:ATP-binding protein [Pseudenhygromyxa sp. WMMC2535]NVB37419.1 PAS domain-containing protein [Pseudenhygromyxa sp. WMMC2535]
MNLEQFLDSLSNEQLIDRLNLALDGASLGIWDWDLRDNSVQFDRRWCEMLGLDHKHTPMSLSTWEERVHPDDIAGCYADIQAYFAGKTNCYENIHRMRHANGEWIYILDRGRISGRDATGEAIRFTGTHFDCTATEQAKRVLSSHRELLVELVRHLPAAVAMFDGEGRYLAASDAWLHLHGLHDRAFIAHTPEELGAPLPKEWDVARRRAQRGERVTAEQDPIVGRDGRRRFLRWSIRPWWRSLDTRDGGILITYEDVTQAVEARLADEREARLAALGLMAGGIAHELNTPLQSLMVNSQLMAQELAARASDQSPDLEFVRECNAGLLATTHRIARIVGALRTVSRHSPDDPLVPVDIRALADQQVELCGARFRAEGVDFRVEGVGPGQACALGRPADIGQILLNLLNNALDAAVEGGKEKTGGAPPWVRLHVDASDSSVTCCVTDSGPGLPPEIEAQLMTPFVTSKAPGKGTGLGLSLSKSLAEKMGAKLIHVASAAQTTFELHIPRGQGPG